MQVNPHTHQVKLCDFGSAKVLVCYIYVSAFLLLPQIISFHLNFFFPELDCQLYFSLLGLDFDR